MPSDEKFVKRHLRQYITNIDNPPYGRLRAIQVLGFMIGKLPSPGPQVIDKQKHRSDAFSATTLPGVPGLPDLPLVQEDDLSSMVEDLTNNELG
jgi:hypothetical protein